MDVFDFLILWDESILIMGVKMNRESYLLKVSDSV
jgi:hypothetical protein